MNRLFCLLMQHKSKLRLLRVGIVVAAIAVAAVAASLGVQAGPFGDYP